MTEPEQNHRVLDGKDALVLTCTCGYTQAWAHDHLIDGRWDSDTVTSLLANTEKVHGLREQHADFLALLERSSLGTPAAKKLRASTNPDDAARILYRADEIDGKNPGPPPVDLNARAPWTDRQVASIIDYQAHPYTHGYNCPVGDGPLAVTAEALTCHCGYRQEWVCNLVADGHWAYGTITEASPPDEQPTTLHTGHSQEQHMPAADTTSYAPWTPQHHLPPPPDRGNPMTQPDHEQTAQAITKMLAESQADAVSAAYDIGYKHGYEDSHQETHNPITRWRNRRKNKKGENTP